MASLSVTSVTFKIWHSESWSVWIVDWDLSRYRPHRIAAQRTARHPPSVMSYAWSALSWDQTNTKQLFQAALVLLEAGRIRFAYGMCLCSIHSVCSTSVGQATAVDSNFDWNMHSACPLVSSRPSKWKSWSFICDLLSKVAIWAKLCTKWQDEFHNPRNDLKFVTFFGYLRPPLASIALFQTASVPSFLTYPW